MQPLQTIISSTCDSSLEPWTGIARGVHMYVCVTWLHSETVVLIGVDVVLVLGLFIAVLTF